MKLLIALAAVLLITAATFFTQSSLAEGLPVSRAMTAGFMILGAWLTGRLCDYIKLPKISGYLLFGIAVGPSLWSLLPWSDPAIYPQLNRVLPLVSEPQLANLRFIGDLAVALIALTAGGEIDVRWLAQRARQLILLLGVDTLMTLVIVGGGIVLARPLMPFFAELDLTSVAVVAMLAAVVIISNSPTVVIAMISDLRANGPLSQMSLALVVCKDLVLIILFATAMSVGQGLLEKEAIRGSFLLAVAAQLLGSIAIGAVLGATMALYVQRVRAHLLLFVVGCCMLFALIGEHAFKIGGHSAHLEPLLIALSAGLLMKNLWPKASAPLFHAIESMSLPVYCLFFAAAGAKADLAAFLSYWHISLGIVVVRTAAVWLALRLGIQLAGMSGDWPNRLWYAMVPQAGVSLVLIALIEAAFRHTHWGAPISSVLIGVVVITQLVGPVGFRYALVATGEVGKGGRMNTHPAA